MRMALNYIRTAYNKNGAVKHRIRSFRFGGKIAVTWSIKKSVFVIAVSEYSLLCKNGYTSLLFYTVGIEKRVFVIHSAQLPYISAFIKHSLGKGGLSRIDMSSHAYNKSFHILSGNMLSLCNHSYMILSVRSQRHGLILAHVEHGYLADNIELLVCKVKRFSCFQAEIRLMTL